MILIGLKIEGRLHLSPPKKLVGQTQNIRALNLISLIVDQLSLEESLVLNRSNFVWM